MEQDVIHIYQVIPKNELILCACPHAQDQARGSRGLLCAFRSVARAMEGDEELCGRTKKLDQNGI